MVLYHSPEQTDLHTYYLSFSQVHCLRFLYKFYSPAPSIYFFKLIMMA